MAEIKILVVEDELIAAESLALDLKRLGYKVVGIVDSGEKAINKSDQTKPDLVLMDIMLKGEVNGIAAAEEIYHQFKIPVVYLTAYADANTLAQAKNSSPYGYLVKPYKAVELNTTIQIAFQKYQEEQEIQEKLAQEKNNNLLKSRALAVASHDLRNPLTNILGYSELLRDYGDRFAPEKRNEYFDWIKYSVNHMTECLEDLLLISKAEEGKLVCEPEMLDIVDFCRQILAEFKPSLSENHRLSFVCQHESYLASLDKKLLRHILSNLIANAIKYSPAGGKIILNLSCQKDQLSCQIQDEGIGMPLAYQAKIFQIFERADNVGSIKGNGLGLSIVKKAVDLHGGTLAFKSQENVGTTFTFTIPT
ncbi:MAG: response regulator [Gomphosphaeria aponina SAG 52.96 = DSM 107014]|uniref:histidine kinase n=1 Tax=Gomphosphaeria aponina SAG 52.96 = DSM 107014 TaxID=1521640 RepID=A0A941GWK1_9CHRO|nr:response regulator [Gomphosphaeria aponina SAG 52.96 = DSM 107014]